MRHNLDISVLELLASKICHDLISPIGAVNNGLEILEDMGGGDEVTELIAFSAGQASAKLQAFRMAYGAGGADASLKPEDVHKSVNALISGDGKVTQNWDPYGDMGYEDRPDGFCKILMCAILQALDCLPKGGELIVQAGDKRGSTDVIVSGENAAPREKVAEALSLGLPQNMLEPKYIHAYTSGLLADKYGFKLFLSHGVPGSVTINIVHPAA
ncbi:MAG: hypothetical protein KDI46_03765 [Alphaproteobacteria bacterium]|nr:hypothetical protein [Alphaproteobacteria bacterium]